MGTKGSYRGKASKAAKALRAAVSVLAENLPALEQEDSEAVPDVSTPDREIMRHALDLFRPASAKARGEGGGAQRSADISASTAATAIAASSAFVKDDAAALAEMGLSPTSMRSADRSDVLQQIVNAACGVMGDGTIEDSERRSVAFSIADKILRDSNAGLSFDPHEAVIEAAARIIAEAVSSETAADLRSTVGSDDVNETALQVLVQARNFASDNISAFSDTDTNEIRDCLEAFLRNAG